MSFLHATGKSLMPGTVTRTTSNSPARPFSSSATARPMSHRATVVSATPILRTRSPRRRLGIPHLLQLRAERVIVRDPRDDLARRGEASDEPGQAAYAGRRE